MWTVIGNKIRIYNCPMSVYWWCESNMTVRNPVYDRMIKMGKESSIRYMHVPQTIKLYANLGRDVSLPFGCLHAVWDMIKDERYETAFNDNGIVIDRSMAISMPLYGYQEEAVQMMLAAKGGVLQASAGSGKTQIGIEMAKRIGRNALWICGKIDLLNQTVERIHQLYPRLPVGTITDGEVKMVTNGITVSTIQTLANVDPTIYEHAFDVVIVDESHNCVSTPTKTQMFGKVVERIAARYKYGLTATPSRSDTLIKAMYAILGCSPTGEFAPTHIIEKCRTNTLTAKHIRVDLDTRFSYDTLAEDGSFDYAALIDHLSQDKARNEAIADNVASLVAKHPKQLVLCQRVEHCEELDRMLKERGVKSVILVGKVSKKRRREILEGMADWEVIVGTVSLVKEGLDIPELSCLHWAMVIGDKVATIQSAGRIERVHEGKPDPEIYDYVDRNYPYCLGKYKKRVSYLRSR